MVFLTRVVRFSAGHRYYLPDLSDEENHRLYGKCANPNGHGHDYVVEVTVKGEIDPITGMVVNISDIKPILEELIVAPLDREFLTCLHPACRGQVPTSENLVRLIWQGLAPAVASLPGRCQLHRVRLAESQWLCADCCRSEDKLMVLLTRSYEFCAAHRLHSNELSDDENQTIFGKCNNPYGHGHNYRLEVTLQGEPDARTGLLIDLNDLDRIVQEEIVERYDHRNLNADTPEFKELNPTSENLVKVIWERIDERLEDHTLYKVTLRETDRNIFAYYGEE